MWFLAAVCNIPVGWYTNKYGNDWPVIIAGSILMTGAHLIYLLSPDCDQCWQSIVPLMILGLSYSIYSVLLYTSLAHFVDDTMMGKAYGISGVFINFGRVIFPPLVGQIQEDTTERSHGYFWVEISLIAVSVLAFIIDCAVYSSIRRQKI